MSNRPQLTDFQYSLPPELVALTPASPRDSARLLIYDRTTGEVAEDRFRNLVRYLPAGALLVFNQTKVLPARLQVTKPTGGVVQLLLVDTSTVTWRAMANKQLTPGMQLAITAGAAFQVLAREGELYTLRPLFPPKQLSRLLARHGQIPLPPYLKASPLTEAQRQQKYQTVFAKHAGSVAAPTASLHFTPRLLKQLQQAGVEYRFVTLHVNMGTFASVTAQQLQSGQLHAESYDVDAVTATAINVAKRAGRPIIAVGTTVARTLESAADQRGRVHAGQGSTTLFIRNQYRWQIVDGLITNFHVPGSSLLMLVATLVGREKLLALYRWAIARRFRFFSFGDGMLIK